MKNLLVLTALALFAVPLAAVAQEPAATATASGGAKVKVKVEIEVEIDDAIALSNVPNALEEAREAGSTETEIHKGYGAMKTIYVKGKPSMKIAQHFKKQALEGYSDEGLGDVIKECVDKKLKDDALVACVLGKSKKEKKVLLPPKLLPKPALTKPAFSKGLVTPPPPAKLDKEAETTAAPTGAMKGKKLGAPIKINK